MSKTENINYKGRCKYEKDQYFNENYKKNRHGACKGKYELNEISYQVHAEYGGII